MSVTVTEKGSSESVANLLVSSDYVLTVKYQQATASNPSSSSELSFSRLVKHLKQNGIHSQVRPAGEEDKVLLFVKAETSALVKHLMSDRLRNYVCGLKVDIEEDENKIVEQLTEADKLRLVYALLVNPVHEDGAGITPGSGNWEFVEKITPIYDYEENKQLLSKWLDKPFIDEGDIHTIKDIAGEKVALYFAYARFYCLWLLVPSILGLISHIFFQRFSIVFTILNSIWAITFINAWKKKQDIYAVAWKTKGAAKVEVTRSQFVSSFIDTDPSTPLESPTFQRTVKEYSFVPVALVGGLLLLTYQLACFFIEIFLNEIYQGPGKMILGLVPTALIVAGAPLITKFYSIFVNEGLKWENHRTQSSYDKSKTQKLFVHVFSSSYAPLFITIFFYLPFGHKTNHYLSTIHEISLKFGVPVLNEGYAINTDRLITQFKYYSITNLIVGFLTENIVPVAIRLAKEHFIKSEPIKDIPEEAEFLKSIRQQISLSPFDVDDEYRELVVNFGYMAIFGPIWSLAPIFSLLSAYIEIKGDLRKLLVESSRPVPTKVEDSEPWNGNLRFLTWLGTIISPIITSFFKSYTNHLSSSSYNHLTSAIDADPTKTLTAALIWENISIFLDFAIGSVFNTLISEVERNDELDVLKRRRNYIQSFIRKSLQSRDIGTDPRERLWENFSEDAVIKQAISISNTPRNHKYKASIEDITPINAKSAFRAYSDNDTKLSNRHTKESTVASKIVPPTQAPPAVPVETPTTPVKTSAPIKTNTASLEPEVELRPKSVPVLATKAIPAAKAIPATKPVSVATLLEIEPEENEPESGANPAIKLIDAAASIDVKANTKPSEPIEVPKVSEPNKKNGSPSQETEVSNEPEKLTKSKMKALGFGRKLTLRRSSKSDKGDSAKSASKTSLVDSKSNSLVDLHQDSEGSTVCDSLASEPHFKKTINIPEPTLHSAKIISGKSVEDLEFDEIDKSDKISLLPMPHVDTSLGLLDAVKPNSPHSSVENLIAANTSSSNSDGAATSDLLFKPRKISPTAPKLSSPKLVSSVTSPTTASSKIGSLGDYEPFKSLDPGCSTFASDAANDTESKAISTSDVKDIPGIDLKLNELTPAVEPTKIEAKSGLQLNKQNSSSSASSPTDPVQQERKLGLKEINEKATAYATNEHIQPTSARVDTFSSSTDNDIITKGNETAQQVAAKSKEALLKDDKENGEPISKSTENLSDSSSRNSSRSTESPEKIITALGIPTTPGKTLSGFRSPVSHHNGEGSASSTTSSLKSNDPKYSADSNTPSSKKPTFMRLKKIVKSATSKIPESSSRKSNL